MKQEITVEGRQNLFDISVQEYGSIQAIYDIAFANDISVTEILEPGRKLKLPKSTYSSPIERDFFEGNKRKVSTGGVVNFQGIFTSSNDYVYQNKNFEYIVERRQNLFDISVQEYGSIQAVYDIAFANDVSTTEILEPGTKLKLPFSVYERKDIAGWFSGKRRKVATGTINKTITPSVDIWAFPGEFPYSF